MSPSTRPESEPICSQYAQRREPPPLCPRAPGRLGRTSLARLTVVVTVLLVIVAAPRAHAAWPAPGDVLVLTTSFDGAKFHGHVFAVDPVTLVKTRVVDFDTFFDPEIYIASSDRHIIPNGIAAAPDGSIWAFYSGGVLLKINADAPHRIYTLGVTQPVSGMAFLPDGRAIVVTNNSTLAGLYRVDPATGEVATFLLNNSPTDPDCNPATSVCLPIHFREGYGVTVDPATGHIYVGDVEGGAKATPTGTVCQELADCGAVYEVVPGAEFLVTDPNSPYFGKKVISGTKTLRADFGDPARGTIGEDAGISIALASDGTILVTDPAFQSAGGKSGALFRVQLNGTHQVVTRFDVLQGQPGGVPNISGPFPVVITGDGTVLIGDCDGDVASLAICAVEDSGVRRLWSDFGVTISIDGVNRPLFGARALAIVPGSPVTPTSSDLEIAVAAVPASPELGSNTTLNVTLANLGPDDATGVTASVPLPAGLSFVSANPAANYDAATGVWTAGAVATGAITPLQIVATLTADSAIVNADITGSDSADPDPTSNHATVTIVNALILSDLAIAITPTPARPAKGSNVTLTVALHNSGPADATGVAARITLPAGVAFVSANAAYDLATGVWTAGSVASGGTALLQIVALITGDVPIVTAQITASSQGDPNVANNVFTLPLMPPGIFVDATCSLRAAIVAANTDAPSGGCPAGEPGVDTIFLPLNSTHEYLDIYENPPDIGPNALPAITSPITIEGRASIIGRSAQAGTPEMRVFFVKAGGALTLRNVTVRNGFTNDSGGGILLEGEGTSLVVDSSRIVGNRAGYQGGGIASHPLIGGHGGRIVISNSVFAGNRGYGGGAVQSIESELTITDTTFAPATVNGTVYGGNEASFGGGVFSNSVTTITGGVINGNGAGVAGALYSVARTTMMNVTVSGNHAVWAGGLFNGGAITVADCTISNNTATRNGGGIYSEDGGYVGPDAAVVIRNSTISANTATIEDGGGIHSAVPVTLTNTTITGNTAGRSGGGMFARGLTTLTNSTITNNKAAVFGGGIGTTDEGPGMTLTTVTIAGNRADGIGGGIFSQSPLAIVGSLIAGNTAGGHGGAISSQTKLTLTNTAVSGNSAVENGGGIYNLSQVAVLEILNSTISGNRAGSVGGGMYSQGPAIVTNTIIGGAAAAAGNAAAGGGGLFVTSAPLTMMGGSISNNVGSNGAGGLASQFGGTTSLSGVLVSSNTSANGSGGGLSIQADADLTNGTVISDNTAGGGGGGIVVAGSGALTMTGGAILRNVAHGSWDAFGGGGGIANGVGGFPGGTVTLLGVNVSENRAPNSGDGGGIFNRGTMFVNGGTMNANSAASGGAIANGTGTWPGGNILVANATLSNNVATAGGGGISDYSGSLGTNNATITGNVAPRGGGIQSYSSPHIVNSRISGNTALGLEGGGGIYLSEGVSSGTVLQNDVISGNHAPNGSGGGISFTQTVKAVGAMPMLIASSVTNNDAAAGGGLSVTMRDRTFQIERSTLNGNRANQSAAIDVNGSMDVFNSTISGNLAPDTGTVIGSSGLFVRFFDTTIVGNTGKFALASSGPLDLIGTIVGGNHNSLGAFSDCSPPNIRSGGYNLVGQGTGCPVTGSDLTVASGTIFTNVLAPLADNGGPTQTHALLPGSPAIDAGVPTTFDVCHLDQRNLPRPRDGDGEGTERCDIGAFEQQTPLPGPLTISSTVRVALRGGPAFTLSVVGSGFTAGSTLMWNGAPRPTTIVSGTVLSADIPASDLATPADLTTARITVQRPDGTTSNVWGIVICTIANFSSLVTSGSAVLPGQTIVLSTLTGGGLPGSGGVTATMTNNTAGSDAAIVTVGNYLANPTPGTVFAAGGFFELQVVGADPTDTVAAKFYYPSALTGVAEAALQLSYWDGAKWVAVTSSGGVPPAKSTTDNLDGTSSGGRFSVVFDNTSTPRVTDLGGTVFAIASFMGGAPLTIDQCKNGAWMTLSRADGTPFKNQGDCIQYVNAGK